MDKSPETAKEWRETSYTQLSRKKMIDSKKSPTGPTQRTPNPEYLTALAVNLGVRW